MLKNISKMIQVVKSSYMKNNCFSLSLINKITDHPYYRLCRYDKPIGCMLLYWPTAWGLAIGAPTLPAHLFLMFFMGAWTSRSAGCIINDYLDKNFDNQVQRCKTRPLAAGTVTTKQALVLLLANLSVGLYVLTQLPMNALIATFAVLPIAALYPLAKRYTSYPQFILGIAFNSGVIIGALTINPLNLNWPATLLMYSAGISWTLIYDTVYAYQDIQDDKKLGLYSTAITWQKNPKQKMNVCLGVSYLLSSATALADSGYIYCLPGFTLSYLYLYNLLKKIDLKNRQQCGIFFKKNTYVGLFILLSLLLRGMFHKQKSQHPQKTPIS